MPTLPDQLHLTPALQLYLLHAAFIQLFAAISMQAF